MKKINIFNKNTESFKFAVTVEGYTPEHDFASRWCWQNIGSIQSPACGSFHSEYPGCPLVLATEYIQTHWYIESGQKVYWSEKAYVKENIPEHGHKGIWFVHWLRKTNYEYGLSEYYFQNETDRDKFVAAIPIFSLGENYEKENDMSKEIYQSKWGYHPISLDASKKLRFINGVFSKAQHLAGAWNRWNRKLPENRVVKKIIRSDDGKMKIGSEIVKDEFGKPLFWKEPQLCPLFYNKTTRYSSTYEISKIVDNGLGESVIFASKQARIPQQNPEDVKKFLFTEEEIDRIYNSAKEWLAKL